MGSAFTSAPVASVGSVACTLVGSVLLGVVVGASLGRVPSGAVVAVVVHVGRAWCLALVSGVGLALVASASSGPVNVSHFPVEFCYI